MHPCDAFGNLQRVAFGCEKSEMKQCAMDWSKHYIFFSDLNEKRFLWENGEELDAKKEKMWTQPTKYKNETRE